jgi:hypothetical protein
MPVCRLNLLPRDPEMMTTCDFCDFNMPSVKNPEDEFAKPIITSQEKKTDLCFLMRGGPWRCWEDADCQPAVQRQTEARLIYAREVIKSAVGEAFRRGLSAAQIDDCLEAVKETLNLKANATGEE